MRTLSFSQLMATPIHSQVRGPNFPSSEDVPCPKHCCPTSYLLAGHIISIMLANGYRTFLDLGCGGVIEDSDSKLLTRDLPLEEQKHNYAPLTCRLVHHFSQKRNLGWRIIGIDRMANSEPFMTIRGSIDDERSYKTIPDGSVDFLYSRKVLDDNPSPCLVSQFRGDFDTELNKLRNRVQKLTKPKLSSLATTMIY